MIHTRPPLLLCQRNLSDQFIARRLYPLPFIFSLVLSLFPSCKHICKGEKKTELVVQAMGDLSHISQDMWEHFAQEFEGANYNHIPKMRLSRIAAILRTYRVSEAYYLKSAVSDGMFDFGADNALKIRLVDGRYMNMKAGGGWEECSITQVTMEGGYIRFLENDETNCRR